MMFKAVASKLKDVNDKINNISESIINDLACRIFFDGLLHPIPSSTILKFSTGSSITGVDILTEACWVNTSIQPSVTFYFSPVEPKELYPLEAAFAFSVGEEELSGIDNHYLRKENELFPALERHGITGPSQVMWGVHDEIRGQLKEAGLYTQLVHLQPQPASDQWLQTIHNTPGYRCTRSSLPALELP